MPSSNMPGLNMSDPSSPPKRRRTKGSFGTKTKPVPWPPDVLPVELFELIIAYLPRSSIQNMRCVNREFENKVSAYLFGVVVVPFKPEIYGIAPEPTLGGFIDDPNRTNDMLHGALMLQDKGMRVFQGFGQHIRKFALSFEFDEKKLANPPVKSDQEAIRTWWGIYRWPFKSYNRYAQLEGLEQTADETRTMAKALRFIGQAKVLGLSVDGGLGWLAGPDVNQKFVERGGIVPVFGQSKFVPEPKEKFAIAKSANTSSSPSDPFGEGQHEQFTRMLQESGMDGPTLEAGVQMMVETENTFGLLGQQQDRFYLPNFSRASSSFAANDLAGVPSNPRHRLRFVSHPITHFTAEPVDATSEEVQDDDDSDEDDFYSDLPPIVPASRLVKGRTEGYSLKPNDLTNAQREMLLEIEWAQRAFMQSYAIAIIDNPPTFHNIETFTIARIPNRHLPILCREDFWDGLPNLNKLSLAVIPDWRDVVKLPTSWVQEMKVAPSQAVTGVFHILEDQISRRENIKTLHFEWVCGGEEAPGLFSRNQHILAAPVVPMAIDMINRARVPQLLSLPHVEHLSLKNCWSSPHILTRLGLALKEKALKTLTLDSVSLTASVIRNAQPNPLAGPGIHLAQNAVAHQLLMNFPAMLGQNAPQPPIPALPVSPANSANNCPAWLQAPRPGSWASVIDALTPGQTLAQIRYARDFDATEPEPQEPGSLSKLEFISCGYVRVALDFDQTVLDSPNGPAPQPASITKRLHDMECVMMKAHDSTLGLIVNYIAEAEIETLENAWNMTLGWGTSRSVLLQECLDDGVSNAGQGRFSGVVWEPNQRASDSS